MQKRIYDVQISRFSMWGLILFIGMGSALSLPAAGVSENNSSGSNVQTEQSIESQAISGSFADPNEYTDLWAYWPDTLPPLLQDQTRIPASSNLSFSTDFTRTTINFDEVLSGGPPKDGIPAIDDPKFLDLAEGDSFLASTESVLVYEGPETLRIYPIRILMFHEIVNDQVDGLPVSVTYCPLCNTGAAFSGIGPEGEIMDFGVSGRLRYSNMIMYDRPTETWWQQATGEGIVGKYAGAQLVGLSLRIMSWEQAKVFAHGLLDRGEISSAEILSEDTGHLRTYGRNPYVGYDQNPRPFLYNGPDTPDDFGAVDRVISFQIGETWDAVPYPILRDEKVVNRKIEERSIAVFWFPGANSPLETNSVSQGRNVGSAQAYFTNIEGRDLEFSYSDGNFLDNQTGTIWNKFGQAISGELEGSILEPVVSVQHFWFSWSAFQEEAGSR